jgi:hypothetical protein
MASFRAGRANAADQRKRGRASPSGGDRCSGTPHSPFCQRTDEAAERSGDSLAASAWKLEHFAVSPTPDVIANRMTFTQYQRSWPRSALRLERSPMLRQQSPASKKFTNATLASAAAILMHLPMAKRSQCGCGLPIHLCA